MRIGLGVRIVVAALLLVAALVGLVLREAAARDAGKEVVLAINTYDPRGPLSGHYVAFQLRDFTEPGHGCPPGAGDYTQARPPKWVALSRRETRYGVTGAAATRAEARALGEVVVRGAAYCFDRTSPQPAVTLEIGVNRFHTDQREAETMAKALSFGAGDSKVPRAFAVVSIDSVGKARLKGLILDGHRSDLTWW